MKQPLTLAEFKLLAKNAERIAVFQEIPAGKLTPFDIYTLLNQALKSDGMMLEDLHQNEHTRRYSFICFEPEASLKIHHNDDRQPLQALRDFQSKLTYATRADVGDLITSAAGFMTYDIVRYFETIPDRHEVDPLLPILLFHFYSLSVTFDHAQQTILISHIVEVSDEPEQCYQQAQRKIASIIKLFATSSAAMLPSIKKKITSHVAIDTSDADFITMVEKAKDYIIRGDAFQIVLSRCFKRQYAASPLEIYQSLRQVSPSPFMFYFPTETHVMLGASPERFIRVHQNQVTVNPIAGTRKSSGNQNYEEIERELLTNTKELAEHMMLVDLARNDVGSVSQPGTVEINELLHVKHFSHVSHITSTISGKLQEKHDALDAFAAAFPAGTLSGAPKIRAMHIVDELETSRRGLYGGAICRLDSSGNFDSCIAIRMAVLNNGLATIRTGAGIVYDSDPAAEAHETYQKARSMLDAIAHAHGE